MTTATLRLPDDWKFLHSAQAERLYLKAAMLAAANQPCYPRPELIFRAFWDVPYDHVRVVWLGQDPYPRPSDPIGRSFAIADAHRPEADWPSSLGNLAKELRSDLGVELGNPTLQHWVNQGVLMLNVHLTTADHPLAHSDWGWDEEVTGRAIRHLAAGAADDGVRLVFVGLGRPAQQFIRKWLGKRAQEHYLEFAVHPCRRSASRGFFGSRIFSRINADLVREGERPILWGANEWSIVSAAPAPAATSAESPP